MGMKTCLLKIFGLILKKKKNTLNLEILQLASIKFAPKIHMAKKVGITVIFSLVS